MQLHPDASGVKFWEQGLSRVSSYLGQRYLSKIAKLCSQLSNLSLYH